MKSLNAETNKLVLKSTSALTQSIFKQIGSISDVLSKLIDKIQTPVQINEKITVVTGLEASVPAPQATPVAQAVPVAQATSADQTASIQAASQTVAKEASTPVKLKSSVNVANLESYKPKQEDSYSGYAIKSSESEEESSYEPNHNNEHKKYKKHKSYKKHHDRRPYYHTSTNPTTTQRSTNAPTTAYYKNSEEGQHHNTNKYISYKTNQNMKEHEEEREYEHGNTDNEMYEDEKNSFVSEYENSNNEPYSEEYKEKKPYPVGDKCSLIDLTRVPGNCYQFYRCSNGYVYTFECPDNLVFDNLLKTCNYARDVYPRCY